MKNYDDIIPPMLEDGLKVMIYAGVQDLICNWYAQAFAAHQCPYTEVSKWISTDNKTLPFCYNSHTQDMMARAQKPNGTISRLIIAKPNRVQSCT